MTKDILKLVPLMSSVSLASSNFNELKKPKKKSEDFIKEGMKNIIGIELIKLQANAVEGF